MTVALRNNFLLNSRGLTFQDTASISWAFNVNLNQLTATALSASAATSLAGGAAGSLPYQSAPNTTAFLAVGTNGYLLTVSAGLPAWEAVPTWNQSTTGNAATATLAATATIANSVLASITPTWTGQHTFSGLPVYVDNNGAVNYAMNSAGAHFGLIQNVSSTTWALGWGNSKTVLGTSALTWSDTGAVTVAGTFACNGSSPVAQPAGYGTPTGAALTSSFAAGSISLANLAAEVAQLILDLKKYGIIGA